MITLKNLTTGDSFDDFSLLNNKALSSNIICKTDCHLAFLEKKKYDIFLSNYNYYYIYKFLIIIFNRGKFNEEIYWKYQKIKKFSNVQRLKFFRSKINIWNE